MATPDPRPGTGAERARRLAGDTGRRVAEGAGRAAGGAGRVGQALARRARDRATAAGLERYRPAFDLKADTDGRTAVSAAHLRVELPFMGTVDVRAAARTDLATGRLEAVAEGTQDGVLVERLEIHFKLPPQLAKVARRALLGPGPTTRVR